jgi:hypothetical protein
MKTYYCPRGYNVLNASGGPQECPAYGETMTLDDTAFHDAIEAIESEGIAAAERDFRNPKPQPERTQTSRSFSTEWANYSGLAAEANRLNKVIVFDALSKAGITHVRVEFDGDSDQGQMGKAEAQCKGDDVPFPAVTLSLRLTEFGCSDFSFSDLSLQEAVEQLCYGYLAVGHSGWEIDDGSFGEFTFDVATRTITLDFYGRLVDTDYSNHTY